MLIKMHGKTTIKIAHRKFILWKQFVITFITFVTGLAINNLCVYLSTSAI
jgi:hypothetical protein